MIIDGMRVDTIIDQANERLNQGDVPVNELVDIMHKCRAIGFETKTTDQHLYRLATAVADRACKRYVAHLLGKE